MGACINIFAIPKRTRDKLECARGEGKWRNWREAKLGPGLAPRTSWFPVIPSNHSATVPGFLSVSKHVIDESPLGPIAPPVSYGFESQPLCPQFFSPLNHWLFTCTLTATPVLVELKIILFHITFCAVRLNTNIKCYTNLTMILPSELMCKKILCTPALKKLESFQWYTNLNFLLWEM